MIYLDILPDELQDEVFKFLPQTSWRKLLGDKYFKNIIDRIYNKKKIKTNNELSLAIVKRQIMDIEKSKSKQINWNDGLFWVATSRRKLDISL